MAPVTATNVGMPPQRIDSPKLQTLMDKLNSFTIIPPSAESETNAALVQVQALVQELAPFAKSWSFEEQADLCDWIPALNAMDAAISYLVRTYPALLLVAPLERKNNTSATPKQQRQEETKQTCARSLQDATSVPQDVIDALVSILAFSSALLRNSINKNVYNSVMEVADLLGAAHDQVATLALETLSSLAIPPALHKQLAPELHHHSTALHSKQNGAPAVQARLLTLARGWGTRASGLGLLHCVTTDDSEYGQGAMALAARQVGHVQLDFYSATHDAAQGDEVESSSINTNTLRHVELTSRDILVSANAASTERTMDAETESSSTTSNGTNNKRRKTSTSTVKETRSTAHLFFACIEQAGGRQSISKNKLLALLADIRLAKAFYSQNAREKAVENRLAALVAVLYAHPSQQSVSGYFQAHPELIVELIDLLRPTVSSASVSAAAARPRATDDSSGINADEELRAISALANSPQVPFRVRSLAVEALTALVARRDGASGGLTGVAKQATVLSELGVGKGLYLGLLPTLIRYSLASLNTFLSIEESDKATSSSTVASLDSVDVIGMDIGMAFVEATKPPPLPLGEQLRCALEFVDTVLTLTSSVVSVPSGTAALTDCGLVPALLSTVAIDTERTPAILSDSSPLDPEERDHARSLLRFITAQSVQIIEGTVVTHNNALSAFHDLQGVDVLTSRLSVEMESIRRASSDECVPMETSDDIEMLDTSGQEDSKKLRSIRSSQRVLLFSIVNCLTVVFHQESGTATNSPLGGVQLRKPELTTAMKEAMDHVHSYGGALAALIASLLSDVMNSDPQVVHHVHGSGLAESFLNMLGAKNDSGRPALPPVAELVMALPNVLSAMSLTEDGATAVANANPFPALLALFYSSEYCMPKSRCMLNEMTAIVGTGLDEIMRHVPKHRPLVIDAVVQAMEAVVEIGARLAVQEEALDLATEVEASQLASLDEQRTCLMQYAMNFGQMLEQILHSEDHCDPFVRAGGLDAILKLFPYLMPSGSRFLAHVSCLSCPSVCTLTHSTTEDQLSMSFKCIALHYDSGILVLKMIAALESQLELLERVQGDLREALAESLDTSIDGSMATSAKGVLEHLPRVPLHDAVECASFTAKAVHLSKYFRSLIELQWLSNLFAGVIRAGGQRNQESGLGWGRNEFKWKKELFSSPSFGQVIKKVSLFCQSANLEACRIRTEDGFEERDRRRLKKDEVGTSPVRYRLRIVCQEGAIVRDGMEIDSCASVGSMEMGEVAVAYDRCVNSSGVMRYRTSRGWVSELTRGHGREPIAEVLCVWNARDEAPPLANSAAVKKAQFNCGISDVCSVGASILARMQSSYCELFSSLSKELVQTFKVIPVRSMSFGHSTVGGYVRGLLEVLSSNIKDGFVMEGVDLATSDSLVPDALPRSSSMFVANDAAISMYIGAQLSHLQACLFEDKRERRTLNVPLLVRLFYSEDGDSPTVTLSRPFFLEATKVLFKHSLLDFQDSSSSKERNDATTTDFPRQSLSRTVAASLPPAISLMRKLMPSSSISSSTLTSILSRLSNSDFFLLMADGPLEELQNKKEELSFHSDSFTKSLQCAISETLLEVWKDHRFVFAPAQVIHPVALLVGEVMSSLDDTPKASTSLSDRYDSERGQRGLFTRYLRSRVTREGQGSDDDSSAPPQANFEPSEDAVAHLMEMGFSRDHALDALESTRTNRVDVAMEYALSLGQLSPDELSARRAAREERARRMVAARDAATNDDEVMADIRTNNESGRGGDFHGTAALGENKELGATESPEERLAQRLEMCNRSWIESTLQVSLDILSKSGELEGSSVVVRSAPDGGKGNAEAEAVTVVLSSFLLGLCQRNPEKHTEFVSGLLDRLASLFVNTQIDKETAWSIPFESAASFASICHATVLCTRALPETRILVLRKGIVRRLVSSIQCFTHTIVQSESCVASDVTWPIWLAPGLLFLDVMAQPLIVPLDQFTPNDDADEEFIAVCEERKQKAANLAKTADDIFSTLRRLGAESAKDAEGDGPARGPATAKTTGESDCGIANTTSEVSTKKLPVQGKASSMTAKPFSAVPLYLPLLSEDSAVACMSLCLELLGKGNTALTEWSLPAGIAQALLSLLMHLLRSPKVASQCLNLGAAELVLKLKRDCRFSGHSGAVTVILRRLLEDESTLQSSMASEMRHAMFKLGEQSQSSPTSNEILRVPSKSFMPAVTPLICRHPVSFLKAAATTVSFESQVDKAEPSDGSTMVVLLSHDQSARYTRALAGLFHAKDGQVASSPGTGEQRGTRAANGAKPQRQKSAGARSASSKRCVPSKKGKKERGNSVGKKNSPVNGTPANHIICLLISKVVALAAERQQGETDGFYGESSSFLWLADALDIMANLVLSIPACAAAIHRYRASNSNGCPSISVSHALSGCPSPPRTFVNFLLHSILPQDRWTFKREQLSLVSRDDNDESAKARKKTAHMSTRVAQTSARLLVALVARAGEGRRRVIADLAFALSGGSLGHATPAPILSSTKPQGLDDHGFHALQAWGDLCIGFASPRSNGAGNENTSTLSFEVVKLMLEFGMAHALLYSLHRLGLQHRMAATTSASLLLPLEVFTRGSVTDSVQAIADKESSERAKRSVQADDKSKLPTGEKLSDVDASVTAGPSPRNDAAFADESRLEDGFDAVAAVRSSRNDEQAEEGLDFDDDEHGRMDDDVGGYGMVVGNVEESDEDGIEIGDDDEEMNDEAGSENETSSDDDSGITEEIDEGSGADSDQDEDESSVDSQDDLIHEDFDIEAEDQEAVDDFLEGGADEEDGTNDRTDAMNQGEFDMDEGWTRIDSSGFGGMLFGTRGVGRASAAANLSARSTRGFIDAAEAMIGSLLRTGEIDGSAISEIEGTLGIRIMAQNQGSLDEDDSLRDRTGIPFAGMSNRGESSAAASARQASTSDAFATVPHVHQRSPPEVGYTAMGGGGRWSEISAMEYVYGGPSVAAGSRNYDLSRIRPVGTDADSYPTPSQVDMRLFPGGPASATHSHTEASLHPLLCGVDLPPMNALVSYLQPHGARAVQVAQRIRRPGEWNSRPSSSGGYLVSTSGGNVVSVHRASGGPFGQSGTGPSTRTSSASALIGWTDDGVSFDNTITSFSTAFERALGESMRAPVTSEGTLAQTSDSQQSAEDETTTMTSQLDRETTTRHPESNGDSDSVGDPGTRDRSSESNRATERDTQVSRAESHDASVFHPRPEDRELPASGSDSSPSDGDGVASSLAEGLRLSPRMEEESTSNQTMATEGQDGEETHEEIGVPEAGTTGPGSTDTTTPMQQEPPQQPAETQGNEPMSMEEEQEAEQHSDPQVGTISENAPPVEGQEGEEALRCPDGIDQEVFDSLPAEMQREIVEQNRAATEVAGQLDSASGLDPEALAALPEDMRREVIEQDQREIRQREQSQADPSNAEEMDNASFLVSLAPDLREEILLTADEAFLNSLPANIIAEAQILRERASMQHHRRANEDHLQAAVNRAGQRVNNASARNGGAGNGPAGQSRKKQRPGKMRLECDRSQIVYLPPQVSQLSPLPGVSDVKVLLRLLYLSSPVRPQRLLQKVFQNICTHGSLRSILCTAFVQLLNDSGYGANAALRTIASGYTGDDDWRKKIDAEFADGCDGFPPLSLVGASPDVYDADDLSPTATLFKRTQPSSSADSISASLPSSAKGSNEERLPPVVATLIIDTMFQLSKSSSRVCIDALKNELVGSEDLQEDGGSTIFDKLLDLLDKPPYSKSSSNLEHLLSLVEIVVSPLSLLPRVGDEEHEISQRDIDSAAAGGKEWVDVPRIVVSQARLQLLCSILRMESCKDVAFTKVNSIARRLCRVDANRGYVLGELGAVSQSLAADAIRDLKTLNIRMQDAVAVRQQEVSTDSEDDELNGATVSRSALRGGGASSSVTLSISSSELKLLRVLQTLQSLCLDTPSKDDAGKKDGKIVVTDQLVEIFESMDLDDLWTNLDSCLHVVKVLEGVKTLEEMEEKSGGNDDDEASDDAGGKKLKNSAAGLLTRFLPIIEAFFVVNASSRSKVGSETPKETADVVAPAPFSQDENGVNAPSQQAAPGQAPAAADALSAEMQPPASVDRDSDLRSLIGGKRLVQFVQDNRVLLNALVRNNPGLLEKGLRVLVQVPRCRAMLDFDVKRHWFKTQVRRLRQHASRRHGSLRLSIRRKYVFEDAYHHLRLRNADEMRGRLHITFHGEEGVDAGGLSREFFGILAKEIFNPNYALFTSTEDGCTFQPNPNSNINPDHLSYFRFVGRIVGKAVADGFLLDAHFTRSLYKHMLGQKPTVGDMEAIDPDYYKNLQMILDHSLDDIGLELTYSIEDISFGRREIIDLLPNGRNIPVTEDSKEKYVSLVCQHRMTTAISSQIKAYLDGFYEMVSTDLIAIFTPRELELLISGLPDIDVTDLKRNTEYQGYRATDKEIQWFWNIMFSLSRSEKAAFLQFVTGSSKVPLAGFSELQGMRGVQKFAIHKAGGSSGALMSAHTCFNSLDLPVYKSEEEMRQKLLYAISEGGGAFMFA